MHSDINILLDSILKACVDLKAGLDIIIKFEDLNDNELPQRLKDMVASINNTIQELKMTDKQVEKIQQKHEKEIAKLHVKFIKVAGLASEALDAVSSSTPGKKEMKKAASKLTQLLNVKI